MSNESHVAAAVSFEVGGGSYGSPSPLPFIQGELKIPGLRVSFEGKFCSKHHKHTPDSYSSPSYASQPSFECEDCNTEILDLIRQELSKFDGSSLFLQPHQIDQREGWLDCQHIAHAHECNCHLGHDCGPGCHTYDDLMRQQKKAAEQELENSDGPKGPHALFQLAAASPSTEMLGVFTRLQSLEQDNEALKNMVTKLLKHLPEDMMKAAVGDAIREKIGVKAEDCEAVGSTQSIDTTKGVGTSV